MNKADKIKILVILFFIFSIIHFVLNRNFIIDGEFLFYKGRTSNVDINSETFSTINVLNYSAKEFNITENGMILPNQKLCPKNPPSLQGPIRVWFDAPNFSDLERLYSYLDPGGHAQPRHCVARDRVAIIIPYRDREMHLRTLLHNLHSLLTRQLLDYAIYVVEQLENETFNRAKLMNVGYAEAVKMYDWQCFIFHDVDLLPEDDRNLYTCPEEPRHMSVAVDKFNYKLPYKTIFGGICALTKEQYLKINGFSNDFWGWGGEDDDIYRRVTMAGYQISRYPPEIARYRMIKHENEKGNSLNKCRYQLLTATKEMWKKSGISSLKYKLISLKTLPLFTHIKVSLNEEESRKQLRREGFTKC